MPPAESKNNPQGKNLSIFITLSNSLDPGLLPELKLTRLNERVQLRSQLPHRHENTILSLSIAPRL